MGAKNTPPRSGNRTDKADRWQRRQPWIGFGLCVAIIVLLPVAYLLLQSNRPSWWGLLAAGLALLCLIVVLLFFLPQRIKEWLIEHGLIATGIILTLLLAIALLLWTIVNVAWLADEGLVLKQQADHPADTGLSVMVAYPKIALLDAQEDELAVTFAQTDAAPLAEHLAVITVAPDAGLTFPDTPGVSSRTFTAELGPYQPDTIRIPLVNDGSFTGLRSNGHEISAQVTIDQTGLVAPLKLTVITEGRRGLALRRFVTSTVDEASPLIFLLLLILPGLAALGQKIVDERFGELKERRRKDFEARTDEFRQYLRLGQLENAKETLKDLRKHAYAREQEGKDVVKLAQVLVDFAEGQVPQIPQVQEDMAERETGNQPSESDRRVLEMGLRWPEEFVAAYLYAHDNLHARQDRQFRTLLNSVTEKLQEGPPALNDKSLQDRLAASLATDFRSAQGRAGQGVIYILPSLMKIPFLRDRAEADLQFLFGGSQREQAFYPRPDWTREFNTIGDSRLIVGGEGSGRTALARWLFRKPDTEHTKIWLAGEMRPRQFPLALVEELFDQVRREPDRLGALNIGQRNILADVLLAYLSFGRALHLVEETQKEQSSLPLQRLRRALHDRASQPASPFTLLAGGERGPSAGEIRLLGDMWRAVGLPGPVFICDVWFRRRIPAQFAELVDYWHTAGALFVLFMPNPLDDNHADSHRQAGKFRANSYPPLLDVTQLSLTWSDNEIYQMVRKRWEAFEAGARLTDPKDRRTPADSFLNRFEAAKTDVERLINASARISSSGAVDHSPRRFMALWCRAVGDQTYDRALVTSATVDEAVRWGSTQWPK